MTMSLRLQLVIAFHEPLARDEGELDRAWDEGYMPLITALGSARIKAALHFTGHLLDHLARRREDTLLHLKRQVQTGELEILGGLFYGGIPALLPEVDVRGQTQMMSEYWESLIGRAPRGLWLPELAWSSEIPRLLADSGLAYGFASSAQLALRRDPAAALVTVERGEACLPAFVLDTELSQELDGGRLDGWGERAATRAAATSGLASAWARAAHLVDARRADAAWIERLAAGLAGHLETALPGTTFDAGPRAAPARLGPGLAPELWPASPQPDFPDFAFRSAGVDNLARRMLRASNKLADAISTMEDEELEDTWSDALATAQRLVFAAQAPDAYLGVDGPEAEGLRTSALGRLIRAEALIDALVQGDGDWLATEEEDADADLKDEVFVCNRHLTAWVVVSEGGSVRALDDRLGQRNLIDSDTGRGGAARAIVDRVLAASTSAGDVLNGGARDLLGPATPWQIGDNRIDEEGDCAYHLRASTRAPLDGGRELTVSKHVSVPIDAAELRIAHDLELRGAPAVILATEIPVRLPGALTAFLANGDLIETGALELSDVESLRLETATGALEVSFEPAAEVWCRVGGERALFVPIVRVEGKAQASLRLLWTAAATAANGNEEPADDGEEPTDDGEELADDGEEPADDGEELADDGEEPADDGEEPADDGEEPADDGEEPAEDDDHEPDDEDPRR